MLEGSPLTTRKLPTWKDPKLRRLLLKNTLVALCHALEDCNSTPQQHPLVLAAQR